MLNLSLAAVSRGEVRAQWEVPVDHPLLEGLDARPVTALTVEVDVRPIGDEGVFVRGRIATVVELPCRRCLSTVREEIDESIDLLFEPLEEGEEAELSGEVYPLPFAGELELGEAIREQLVLRLPRYALCDEACRGLCPQCGTSLNEGSCDCVGDEGPGPWDALKKLTFE
jgi:uncharacterized protein